MNIVHMAAGAGEMYCGACARDVAMARGLIARGHDVQVIPLYTPLRLDGNETLPTTRVFLGGINAYLQQSLSLFRYTPAFIDRLFDSPSLLRWASRFAVKTSPRDLGPMTVSVLAGRDGLQRKEVEKLMRYLESGAKPDVISITNSMLSAIAPEVKKRLNIPVVCGVQGEDTFIDSIPEPYKSKCRELIHSNAQHIDRFIAPSDEHAARMAEFMGVAIDKITVVRTGIDASRFVSERTNGEGPFQIGYLSAIIPAKGLDLLIDACATLRAEGRSFVVHVAGKVLNEDYWKDMQKQLITTGMAPYVMVLGELGFDAKVAMLRACDVYAMPTRIHESRAVSAMEALACGTPVVAPNSGVFPELFGRSGGGVLFPHEDVRGLAYVLGRMMDDPAEARCIGLAGADGIARHYTVAGMAEGYEKAMRREG